MGKKRLHLYVSSSISNFKEKLLQRTGLKEYHPVHNLFDDIIFFGMYHEVDYFRLTTHQGRKKIFWCGSDILNLKKKAPIIRNVIKATKAHNYCENDIEKKALYKLGIKSEVRPMMFDDKRVPVSFEYNKNPHVYTTTHPVRGKEYGVELIEKIAPLFPNITFHIYGNLDERIHNNTIYHGIIPEKQFNQEIRNYQGALRLNRFDGFSEILAKSILMGQYPISFIPYPHITHVYNGTTLRRALEQLSYKKKPNKEGRNYWKRVLSQNLDAILS